MTGPARAARRERPAWMQDPMVWMIVGLLLGAVVVACGATLGIYLHVQAERATPAPTVTVTATPPPSATPTPSPSPSRR